MKSTSVATRRLNHGELYLAGVLDAHGVCHDAHAGLAEVVHRAARYAVVAENRGHVDYVAVALLDHLVVHGGGGVEGALYGGVDALFPGLHGELVLAKKSERHSARIVD